MFIRRIALLATVVVVLLSFAPSARATTWPVKPACHNSTTFVQFQKLDVPTGNVPHIEKWNVLHTHVLARISVGWHFCYNPFMGEGRLAWTDLVSTPTIPWYSSWSYDGIITNKTVWGCVHDCASIDRYLQFEFHSSAQHWYPCMRFKIYGSGWLDIAGAGGGSDCDALANGA